MSCLSWSQCCTLVKCCMTPLRRFPVTISGYIYVGEECWRRDVLVTTIRCFWHPLWSPTSTFFLHKWAPIIKRCHQHRVTKIHKSSPTLICFVILFNVFLDTQVLESSVNPQFNFSFDCAWRWKLFNTWSWGFFHFQSGPDVLKLLILE